MACIVQVTRRDVQTLFRQGWVLIGDGVDRRDESRRERRERLRDGPSIDEWRERPQRERDAAFAALEGEESLSALLYLNGAERENDPDMVLDFDTYVRLNVSLESFHRLLDGETVKWGERYGRPLYLDSEGSRLTD